MVLPSGAWPYDWMISDLSDIVEATGSDGFAHKLLTYVDRMIGADYCTVFRAKDSELTKILSVSRPGLSPATMPEFSTYDARRQLSAIAGAGIHVSASKGPPPSAGQSRGALVASVS